MAPVTQNKNKSAKIKLELGAKPRQQVTAHPFGPEKKLYSNPRRSQKFCLGAGIKYWLTREIVGI